MDLWQKSLCIWSTQVWSLLVNSGCLNHPQPGGAGFLFLRAKCNHRTECPLPPCQTLFKWRNWGWRGSLWFRGTPHSPSWTHGTVCALHSIASHSSLLGCTAKLWANPDWDFLQEGNRNGGAAIIPKCMSFLKQTQVTSFGVCSTVLICVWSVQWELILPQFPSQGST